MRRKNGNSYTIKGSGIGSFSIVGFLCFFLIIPLVLSLFVILDHTPYVKGYEEHLKSNISTNEVDALNKQIEEIQTQIAYVEEQIGIQEEYLSAQKETQINIQNNAINVKQAELDSISASLIEAQTKANAFGSIVDQAEAVLSGTSVAITDSQVQLLKKSIDNLTAQVATYQAQIDTLNNEIDELKQERQNLIGSITGNVEIKKDETAVKYPTTITLDADDAATYNEYIGYEEVYFFSIVGGTEPTDEGLKLILSSARNVNTAIQTKKTELDTKTAEFNTVKDKIEKLIDAYNTYNAAYKQAEKDGDSVTMDQILLAMNATKDSISTELTTLKAIQAEIDTKLETLKDSLSEMETHVQSLEDGKAAIAEVYGLTENNSQIKNKETQIQTIEAMVSVLDGELDGYKNQLTSYKNEQASAEKTWKSKVTSLTRQKNTLQSDLETLEAELESLKNSELTDNTTDAFNAQIEIYNKNIAAINKDIEEINYLCSLTGSEFLVAAYADNFDDIYPYPQSGQVAAGAFGLTSMLVSQMNISVGLLNLLPLICYMLAAVLAVLTLFIVIIKVYVAKKTSYTLEENVLIIKKATVFTGREETRKVFYSPGMSVAIDQTLKGSIFNYGNVVISMGLGNAGEIVMRNVKRPNKAKKILTQQLAKLSYTGYPHDSNIPNMCNSPYAYGFGLPYMGGFGGFGYYPPMLGNNSPDCSKCMLKNMLPVAPQQPQQ